MSLLSMPLHRRTVPGLLAQIAQLGTMPAALFLPMLPLALLCGLGLLYGAAHYRTPEQIPYWTLFFGLPHIVASLQSSCDAEYRAAYGRRTWVALGLLVLPLALRTIGVPPSWTLAVFVLLTVYHVIAQQFGIALAAARQRPSALSAACKWSTVVLGTIAYFQAYLVADLQGSLGHAALVAALDILKFPLLALIVTSGAALIWGARQQRVGATLLALNLWLFVAALWLIFETPFVLIGLMLVRVLHDLTGFVAYIRHDMARNRSARKNLLYRALPFLPVWLLGPLLALLIAAGLSSLAGFIDAVGWLLIGLNLAHYYTESFVWRSGSPHRRYFSLSGS